MRLHLERLIMLMTAFFLALAVGASAPDAVTALAVVALLALAVRLGAVRVGARLVPIGRRARAHRLGLDRMPSPQHPRTAGRTRSRAPARSGTVA